MRRTMDSPLIFLPVLLSLLALLLLPLMALPQAIAAADTLPGVDNPMRARTNYMLNCQGCHGPDGAGSTIGEVPRMKGFIGNFLRVPGGREFMVQVPGSANAALTDADLAELLNWIFPMIGGEALPVEFVPYTALEVAELRKTPEIDVVSRRAGLINAMQAMEDDTLHSGSRP